MLTLFAVLAGVVLGVLTGPVLGWRHAPSYRRRLLRGWWLLLAGVVLTVGADRVAASWLAQVMLVAGYLALVAFAIVNRRMVGMGIVAAGLLLNAAVVTVDGGMPVRPAAVAAAGLAGRGGRVGAPAGHRHHLQGSGDRLTALDDWIAFPAVHQVVSVGDLILLVGLAEVVAHLMPAGSATAGAWLRSPRRRRTGAPSAPAAAATRPVAPPEPALVGGPPVGDADEDTAGHRYPPSRPPQLDLIEVAEPLPPLVTPTLQ